MKKIIVLFLLCVFSMDCAAYSMAPIVDNFAENSLKHACKIERIEKPPIRDEFAERTLINLEVQKIIQKPPIVDELGEYLSTQNLKIIKKAPVVIMDSMYETPVFVVSNDFITTQREISEGKTLNFTVSRDVVVKDKIVIAKGTHATGRVELITMNGAYGTPADLTVGNFSLQDGRDLLGQIKRNGANRSLWVYPAAYVGTFFFGVGILLVAIRGGHAKIKQNQEFELIYLQNP